MTALPLSLRDILQVDLDLKLKFLVEYLKSRKGKL